VVQAREALDDGRAERMLGQLRDLAPHFPAPQEG
jgi:hypothetical protein